jgi:hypothetical protein
MRSSFLLSVFLYVSPPSPPPLNVRLHPVSYVLWLARLLKEQALMEKSAFPLSVFTSLTISFLVNSNRSSRKAEG